MAQSSPFPLVAVDVGNSRVKLGVFDLPLVEPLPHAHRTVAMDLQWTDAQLDTALSDAVSSYRWSIASVNRPARERLLRWLESRQVSQVQVLTHTDLPVRAEVARPEAVGIDRLANAVAVNRLRAKDEAAIIVNFGSALVVDLITPQGTFAGGAILPGVAMSARALHEFTDLLPLVELTESPLPLGKSTIAAIGAGLYWGTVGAVRELVNQLAPDAAEPQIFMTGGAAPIFVNALSEGAERPPQFVPHLTLAGITLAALHIAGATGAR